MGFAQAVRTCLGKYVTFSGRAGRPEYWWFILFVMLGVLVLSLIDGFVFGSEAGSLSPLTSLFQLLTFLPVLAAAWRRLHDSGKPGWYVLLPMAVSLMFSLAMLSGVTAFGVVEAEGVPADQLGGPASLLGLGGFALFSIIELVLLVLMIWWLTRPSDPGPNAYGPPP
ncbi:MAG: DUF805 domain-containing protein [Geminicoccaceae bacterium]